MIPLYKPFMPELPEMQSILHSGHLAYGKWGREFESRLRTFIGNKNLLTTNTYSNAIYVALSALGLEPGDEVIASPMACLASNQPLSTYGLNVRWADIDPSTGTLDPDSVLKRITPRTKLIFHNHFCGYVGYANEIYDLARSRGLLVIDDCVEAFGAEYNGIKLGNLSADASVFSFQTVRLPNTIEGGAVAFADESLMVKAILTRDFGIDRTKFRDANAEISPNCDIKIKGYAGMMSDINSYIGCVQMEYLPGLLLKQRDNAVFWGSELGHISGRIVPLSELEHSVPSYWVYGVLSDNKVHDILMFRDLGFYASGVHLPNSFYSVFGEHVSLPGVTEFNNKYFAIPCGWWIKDE